MYSFMRYFESLGNNCELGFVLEKAGIKEASLFKWTLIEEHIHLIAALGKRFEGLYQADLLVPRFKTMVRDRKYGLCFHTSLPIVAHRGRLVFDGSEVERSAIYEREQSKFHYFATTFLERLKTTSKIYVYRSNQEVPLETLRTLGWLLRKSGGSASLLIMKQADADHAPGTAALLEEGLYEGYLGYLSTDPDLQDIDFDSWFETCGSVWRLHASLHGLPDEAAADAPSNVAPSRLPEGFDPMGYLLANPDVAEVAAAEHYLHCGWREGRPLT